jgi:hypothetical protein
MGISNGHFGDWKARSYNVWLTVFCWREEIREECVHRYPSLFLGYVTFWLLERKTARSLLSWSCKMSEIKEKRRWLTCYGISLWAFHVRIDRNDGRGSGVIQGLAEYLKEIAPVPFRGWFLMSSPTPFSSCSEIMYFSGRKRKAGKERSHVTVRMRFWTVERRVIEWM